MLQEKNKFQILKHSLKKRFILQNSESKTMNFILLPEDEVTNIRLLFDLNVMSSLQINWFSFAKCSQNVAIQIETINHQNYGNVTVKTIHLVQDEANLSILINSEVGSKTIGNKVDQSIQGLLMSPLARINGDPVLKINSEDVIAKHSLKLGSIDLEETFYLMSKGMSKSEAEQTLIYARLNDLFPHSEVEMIKELFN